MKGEMVKLLAIVGLGFCVLLIVASVLLAGSVDGDVLLALISLLAAAVFATYGAWTDRILFMAGGGLVFLVISIMYGSLLWIVPGLLFLSSAILATARE